MTRLLLFYSGKAEQMTVINCSVLILTSRKYVLDGAPVQCHVQPEYKVPGQSRVLSYLIPVWVRR